VAKFTRVLIANRGEIAVRIARSVQSAGLQAIAVYSEPDKYAPHVQACDVAVALGGSSAAESYLDVDKVIAAAATSGAQAIHPGYGFLSENADFARRCEAEGLTFIGPSPEAIALMGSKRAAKVAVAEAGVPCIAGYDGADQSDAVLASEARRIGMPIMVKASSGGGGRGMRLVTQESELLEAIASARSEAQNAFGDGELILEKAITTGRHIEVQVAADSHGKVIHLGERDCSMQRRHQKVIEEAPSPFVDDALREAMGQAAVNAAKSCGYLGVGTVEFLVAEDRSFSFLEMNTRLQVEHPVTELVTGIDLVEVQLRIAQGEALGIEQREVVLSGHAIEARIYAEDPASGFVPQTGVVQGWGVPQGAGIRVDSGINAGCVVSPYYDPMLAKIMAFGETRELARSRLRNALEQTTLLGFSNNQQFLFSLLGDPVFVDGDATITYLDQHAKLHASSTLSADAVAVAAVVSELMASDQAAHFLNWSNAEPMERLRTLSINGQEARVGLLSNQKNYSVRLLGQPDKELEAESISASIGIVLEECSPDRIELTLNGVRQSLACARADNHFFVQWGAQQLLVESLTYAPAAGPGSAASGEVQALTEGELVTLDVAVGDRVTKGQTLAVVEAMKMQHRHIADGDGVVKSIDATLNAQVSKGQLLVSLTLDSDASEKTEIAS